MPKLPPPRRRSDVCVKCRTSFSWHQSKRNWCWWCEGKPRQKGKKP